MRVNLFSEIDGVHAFTSKAGQKLYELIEPAVARGEEVVLDFDGVKHFSGTFFNWAIGRFIEKDFDGKLSRLIRYENLPPLGQGSLESAVEYATLRRENPRWAVAMEAAVRRRSEEARE
jgi:hypothetical protein